MMDSWKHYYSLITNYPTYTNILTQSNQPNPPQPTASLDPVTDEPSHGVSVSVVLILLEPGEDKLSFLNWSRLSRSVFFEPVSRGAGGWKGLDFVGLTFLSAA